MENNSMYAIAILSLCCVDIHIWLLAGIYEIDLFPNWFPFMAAARELKTVSRFRKFAQLTVRSIFPFDARDMYVIIHHTSYYTITPPILTPMSSFFFICHDMVLTRMSQLMCY
jgi:hypothetical protein